MGGGASKKQQASSQGSAAKKESVKATDKEKAQEPLQKKNSVNEVEDFIPRGGTPTPPGSPEIYPMKSSTSKTSSKTSPKKGSSEASSQKPAWDDQSSSSAWGTNSKVRKRPPELTSIETPEASAPGVMDLPSPHSSEESFCVIDESTGRKVSQSAKKTGKSTGKDKQGKVDFCPVLPKPGEKLETEQYRVSQLENCQALPAHRGGGATRITLFAGIMDNDRSARYDALHELCELLKEPDDGSVEPEFNLTMVTEIMGLLMDREVEVRSKAAETVVNMARSADFASVSLEVVLERLYSMLQASQHTDEAAYLCSGASLLVAIALETFLGPEARKSDSDLVANSTIHLQAAIWDMTAFVQRGLNGELSEAAKESAINLAVAVFLHLGVDESSNLIDGCPPSMISLLFEKFADAEGQDAPISPDWGDMLTDRKRTEMAHAAAARADEEVFGSALDFGITANEESLMDDILEEVGLAFDDVNERLVRDKIIVNAASSGRTFSQSKLIKGSAPSIDDELAGLGLPDDLMAWTKNVLADDIEALS